MVRIRDEGVFDAPIDKVWKYVNDPEGRHEHPAFRMGKILEQAGNRMVVEADVRDPGGKGSHKETWKFVFNPTKSFDMEYLSGPSKGSKHTHTYTPLGDKTRVVVEGDFQIQGLDESQTRKAVLDYFEMVFNEDNAALKKYK